MNLLFICQSFCWLNVFHPLGYRLIREIWQVGEPLDGPTTDWLRCSARQYGIYVGTSFPEARGEHFYNTFALAGPDGKLAGTVCKRSPFMWEAYFFIGQGGSPYIDTEIGRLNELPVRVVRQYNELFGVPVVMANKSGIWELPVPNGILGQPEGFTFPGRSLIVDADGVVKAQLSDEEALAAAASCAR